MEPLIPSSLEGFAPVPSYIRQEAWQLHADVNQHYDHVHPYGYHLDMVARFALEYAPQICDNPTDLLAIWFGAYFHDSIEDARLTYNNVMDIARRYFDADHALIATEIVYALTNEKGRTRAERADHRYYAGIRSTPYAPLVKLADRLANMSYSARSDADAIDRATNAAMRTVYAKELPHFLTAISPDPQCSDRRLTLPAEMVKQAEDIARS